MTGCSPCRQCHEREASARPGATLLDEYSVSRIFGVASYFSCCVAIADASGSGLRCWHPFPVLRLGLHANRSSSLLLGTTVMPSELKVSPRAGKQQWGTLNWCPSASILHSGALPCQRSIASRPIPRMGGEPCIRDLRITVRRVVEAVALYPDREELKREYPELENEDIRQALTFAAASLDDQVLSLSIM